MRRWRAARRRVRLPSLGNSSVKMSLLRFWMRMRTWMLRRWNKRWSRIYWKRWRNVPDSWRSSSRSFSTNLPYKRSSAKKHPQSIEVPSIAATAASNTKINQSQHPKRPSSPQRKQLHPSPRSTEAKASSLKKWASAQTSKPADSSAKRPSTKWSETAPSSTPRRPS